MSLVVHPSDAAADRAIAALPNDATTVEFFEHLAHCRDCRGRFGPLLLLVEAKRRRDDAPQRPVSRRLAAPAGAVIVLLIAVLLRHGPPEDRRVPASTGAPTVSGFVHELRYRESERLATALVTIKESAEGEGLRRTGGEVRYGETTLKWSTTEFVGRRESNP